MQLDGRKVALESCILVLPAVERILVLPALKRILVLPAVKRILLLELRRKLLEVVDRALKVWIPDRANVSSDRTLKRKPLEGKAWLLLLLLIDRKIESTAELSLKKSGPALLNCSLSYGDFWGAQKGQIFLERGV